MENLPIVVYSQLRWSAAQSRHQDLLSRISDRSRVIYFEEAAEAEEQVPEGGARIR